MIILDLETTGLETDSEILQVAIIDENANVLLNTLVKPLYATSWKEAEEIHKITSAMVENAPTIAELLPTIIDLIKDQEVIIYNAEFDTQFLPIKEYAKSVHCCMLKFAEHYGEWSDYFGSYKYQKLSFACEYTLWENTQNLAFHNALNDCLATLYVWEYLHSIDKQREVQAKKERIVEKKEIEKTISTILRKERWQKEREEQELQNKFNKKWSKNNYQLDERNFYSSVWYNKFNDYFMLSTWLEMYFYFVDNGLPISTKNIRKYQIITQKIGYISDTALENKIKREGYLFKNNVLQEYYFVEKNMYSVPTLMYNSFEVQEKKDQIREVFFSTRPENTFTKTEIKKLKKRVEDFAFIGYGKNRNNNTYYELYKEK